MRDYQVFPSWLQRIVSSLYLTNISYERALNATLPYVKPPATSLPRAVERPYYGSNKSAVQHAAYYCHDAVPDASA